MSKINNILGKINALLNKTIENGASEAEAESALIMAQKLMTKHMIEESQLAEHGKDKKCERITIPLFKTGYDTTYLNGSVASAFDCRCWWNEYNKELYFFGYGEDAKLAAYFYNYLNNAVINEAEKYKKSAEYKEQIMMGFHGKTIMSSFRKGMIFRLVDRLEELKNNRTANVLKSTGKDLVIIKDAKVQEEYDNLNLNLTTKKSNHNINNAVSFSSGKNSADNVNMAGGIETKRAEQIA